MKSLTAFFFFLAVSCSAATAFTTPVKEDNSLVLLHRQQLDLYASSRRLIEQLVETIRKAAREASDAIANYTADIQEEAKLTREKLVNDVQRLRGRVTNAIEGIRNRLIDSGVAVIDCIASHDSDANALFNQTITKTITCVDDRIAEVGNQINDLKTMAESAVEFGNNALENMRKCTEEGGMLAAGSCLGSVSVQTEMRAVVFGTQCGLSIARINLSIATLPAALEVCAGSRLVESGMATARILMDIGTCSASSVFTAMTGDVALPSDAALQGDDFKFLLR